MTAIVEQAGSTPSSTRCGERGYTVIGPTVRSQSIVYDELHSADDLPGRLGRRAGRRHASACERRGDDALFAPHRRARLAQALPVPAAAARLARAARRDGTLEVEQPEPPPRYAFIGVRSCDLHAVAIQDRVFLGDRYVDADYEARRRDAFFVAVNCARAGRHLLLRLDGHGPARRPPASTWR